MRILCTADLHIGRVSSRLPPEAEAAECTAREVWSRIVDLALAEKVDLVAVAGDVIDASANYFEAFGPLEQGLRKLSDAGIETCFVAGNHDFEALPRFFGQFSNPRVHLLGRDGVWQRHTIERNNERLHVDGWSFHSAQHAGSPLLGYECKRDAVPVLGLLHSDVEQTYSSYAPCTPDELHAAGPDVWLLGHIHRPREFPGGAKVACYPGSPQALDPGEQGAHGIVLIEWPGSGAPTMSKRPLSTIRYEEFPISIDGCEDESGVELALHAGLEKQLQVCLTEAGPLRWLNCRVRLNGRTGMHSQLALHGMPNIGQLRKSAQRVTALVQSLTVETRPMLDIEKLAIGCSPRALLAQLLLALDRREEHPLLAKAQQRLVADFQTMPIDGDGSNGEESISPQQPPDEAAIREMLLTQGYRLLAQFGENAS